VRIDPNDLRDSVRRLTIEGGYHPRWRSAGVLEFQSGRRHFSYQPATGRIDTTIVALSVPDPSPSGTVALANARLITLAGRRVIERGTVLVRAGRIACVGRCDTRGADRVLDLAGKTIVPGFVDVHAHHLGLGSGAVPEHRQHRSESALYLAYGVTTALDPSVDPLQAFATAELVNAGRVVGPRTFSTGDAVMPPAGSNGAATYREMEGLVNRLADWGALSIKFYLSPRRDQRQWVAEAARRRGLSVTNEGADLEYNLSCVLDGHTGWEHPMMYLPLYRDAAKAFGQAHAVYSPTLTVAGAGFWAEEYWQARSDLWNDPKLRRFVPWERLSRSISSSSRPLEEYSFPMMAEAVADLVRAGGYASLGGHGEQIGLDSHWEIWAYGQALEPIEALEVASLGGARMAGLENDLGSIEVGKLADLVVLDANPLENLRRTTEIRYVMKGGRIYEATTLDEIWPERRPYGPIPWAAPAVHRPDARPMDVWDKGAGNGR
jgi:imidazolonepropionase-like amidohydrolase